MQKYKQAAISIAFLTIILSAGVCAGKINFNNSEKNKSDEVAILESFEENDYEYWKKLIGKKTGMDKIVSKDDFDKFVKARNAVRSMDYEEAIKISKELEDRLKKKIGANFFQFS